MNYHIIRMGESIYKLSELYNVSVEEIVEANQEINPNMLMIGQVVCIPI